MAALSDAVRTQVWAEYMRSNRDPIAATKPQLRAAINAADDWIDTHFATFVMAVPVEVRATPSAETLLANSAAIAANTAVADVASGVAGRDQSGVLLQAYNGAAAWLATGAPLFLQAVGTACAGTLTQVQMLSILEAVARRRAVV